MDADRRPRPSGRTSVAGASSAAAALSGTGVSGTGVAGMTMAELMRDRPASVPVLLRRGLACPGCAMAPFMTVREAADAYGIDLDALLDDLAAVDRPALSVGGR